MYHKTTKYDKIITYNYQIYIILRGESMKKESIILCGIAVTILISAGFTISQGTISSADDNYVTPKSIIEELEEDLELEDDLDEEDNSDEDERRTTKKTSTSKINNRTYEDED